MSKELRPCPFCGEVKALYENEFFAAPVDGLPEANDHVEHRVECQNCGATGPWVDTHAGAIEAWNKREEKEVTMSELIKVKEYLNREISCLERQLDSAKNFGWQDKIVVIMPGLLILKAMLEELGLEIKKKEDGDE